MLCNSVLLRSPCGVILSCGLLDKVMATSIAVRLVIFKSLQAFFFSTLRRTPALLTLFILGLGGPMDLQFHLPMR